MTCNMNHDNFVITKCIFAYGFNVSDIGLFGVGENSTNSYAY